MLVPARGFARQYRNAFTLDRLDLEDVKIFTRSQGRAQEREIVENYGLWAHNFLCSKQIEIQATCVFYIDTVGIEDNLCPIAVIHHSGVTPNSLALVFNEICQHLGLRPEVWHIPHDPGLYDALQRGFPAVPIKHSLALSVLQDFVVEDGAPVVEDADDASEVFQRLVIDRHRGLAEEYAQPYFPPIHAEMEIVGRNIFSLLEMLDHSGDVFMFTAFAFGWVEGVDELVFAEAWRIAKTPTGPVCAMGGCGACSSCLAKKIRKAVPNKPRPIAKQPLGQAHRPELARRFESFLRALPRSTITPFIKPISSTIPSPPPAQRIRSPDVTMGDDFVTKAGQVEDLETWQNLLTEWSEEIELEPSLAMLDEEAASWVRKLRAVWRMVAANGNLEVYASMWIPHFLLSMAPVIPQLVPSDMLEVFVEGADHHPVDKETLEDYAEFVKLTINRVKNDFLYARAVIPLGRPVGYGLDHDVEGTLSHQLLGKFSTDLIAIVASVRLLCLRVVESSGTLLPTPIFVRTEGEVCVAEPIPRWFFAENEKTVIWYSERGHFGIAVIIPQFNELHSFETSGEMQPTTLQLIRRVYRQNTNSSSQLELVRHESYHANDDDDGPIVSTLLLLLTVSSVNDIRADRVVPAHLYNHETSGAILRKEALRSIVFAVHAQEAVWDILLASENRPRYS